ncbi:MAG: hypothetical protein OET90_02790, partial [Desulfuromonadales bacterium]|nr:hypothetical protein [Desulfuromonadales bacterium]
IPENSKLAIRLDRWDASSSTDLTLTSGTTATKGQLLVNVQPYNNQPNGSFAIALNSPEVRSGGYIDIAWVSANPQDVGQTVHYDIFGSADGGSSYPYVIATAVTDIDDLNGAEYGRVTWDTVGDGLTSSYSCKVKVEVGDGYQYEDPSAPNYPDPFEEIAPTVWSTHNVFESATIAVDNNTDVEPPASVTIMSAETRPKQGSVYLTWTAVGDDGLNHGTRVAYYDIRYRPDPIGTGTIDAGGNWDVAVQAEGEPVPGFSGSLESFDLLGLAPELEYDIGIKACDEADNCSTLGALSTSEGWRTDAAQSLPDPIKGGPFYCGICHSTPPDEPDTKGIHREHGFTLEDCAKCHGDGTNPSGNDVTQYDGRHYNGFIDIGWAKSDVGGNQAALVQIPIENGGATDVTITQTTVNNGAVTIYQDLGDGAGGYNMPAGQTATATAYTDSGTCMNFGLSNSNGCHGPFQPQWAPSVANPTPTAPACSDCHGDSSAARNWDPYGRIWDCNDAGAPSELVKASPPIDNHGESALTSKYTGAHERHLNSSFRFAKGDSCRLCHLDTMYSGEHADGKVDIRFDEGANQSDSLQAVSQFDGPEATTGMSCGQLSTDSCHDTFESDGVTPKALVDWPVWNVDGAQCDSCHGMSTMGTVPHISDNGARACDWCHLAGHPQSPDGVNPGDSAALLVNNNPAVGIDYKSGGIHIRLNINNRDTLVGGEPVDTLAEICWACHEAQSSPISEWGGDDTPTNTVVEPYNGVGSIYDYGSLNITSWYADTTQGSEVGATWSSADATNFGYKTGRIQSTHSTDPSGVSTVTWDAANGRYNETIDAVAKIRCTNCHDVHDLNKTDGDTVSGAPYLRGTWKSNPYEEDGAPWNKNFTSVGAAPQFGPVPRGATAYIEKGGYFIDQNNVRPGTTTSAQYPTSGWTMASSAGLCALCHDSDVDGMDQLADEYLWVGQGVSDNGHSNSAVGGTFVNSTNVFDYTHGRPTPPATEPNIKGTSPTGIIPDMAVMARATATIEAGETYIYAYRSTRANGPMAPEIAANYAYNSYNWGATVDAGQTDTMYHQFSCSKCHNPHASRLPKLMITNCLDIRHNTWDDGKSTRQNSFTNSALSAVDRNMPAAYYASAQNCHRFDPARSGIERGGWNRVTPWVKKNDGTNSEHKGSMDTAYGDTSPTYHKFPTENTGW